MKIHQITDLHVPDDDSDKRFDHVRGNVLRQFEFIAAAKPDLLVISGDLTMVDASEIGCRWVYKNMPDVPVVVIPGNHDDPKMIEAVFGRWPQELDYVDCLLIFLDTSSDYLPKDQISILRNLASTKPCALFLHHPPHLIGSGFMSKNYPLRNYADAAQAILNAGIDHVFCGHYHNSARVACNGFDLYLTPSPAFQIALETEQYTMEKCRPAVRTIDVSSGHVCSELVYV
jgi:Icc protein